MHEKYVPQQIEKKWQKIWEDTKAFETHSDPSRKKYYVLEMFPYPSGNLHMGHVRNYSIGDVVARFKTMQGFNVIHPMGFDAFGMPAENAAIKHGIPPAEWTYSNIDNMTRQQKELGLSYDWDRKVLTCREDYYKHTQKLFEIFYKRGLAYKKEAKVNWCESCHTVLANEQVEEGRCWRCKNEVVKKDLSQWFLKITDYADRLLADLDHMPGWPERVKTMQRNWIGRSTGTQFSFKVEGMDDQIPVYTTRVDTVYGVTYMVLAPEHPLVEKLIANNPEKAKLEAFIEKMRNENDIVRTAEDAPKLGMFTGSYAIHPLTGERVPIWIANYVLYEYGTGAVMAVPTHDQRDWDFAKKYSLPMKLVVQNKAGSLSLAEMDKAYDADGVLVNSAEFDGLKSGEAREAITKKFEDMGIGEGKVNYRLRDWLISRQRYWGCPIPIIHCPHCGNVLVPEKDLPVKLPEDVNFVAGATSPLETSEAFLHCKCPQCGADATRETDTMDTFIDSCWYYMRYTCPDAGTMVDGRNDYWMPMDQYIGGIEHAILHLLYARFWTKVMRDLGLVKFDEPFTNLLTQGMVLNETYYREDAAGKKHWINPADVDVQTDERGRPIGATLKADGQPVVIGGVEKMSKSKNNGIDPQALIDQYGADTARLFTMFAAPPEQQLEWNDAGVEGASRFLRRMWNFGVAHGDAIRAGHGNGVVDGATDADRALRRELHTVLKQANYDYERLQYNTVVSATMKMLNALEGAKDAGVDARREGFGILLRVLYPVVPHITHVLWQELGYAGAYGSLLDAPWPQVDDGALVQSEIELVLQVNGKVRGSIVVPADADRAAIEAIAAKDEAVHRFAEGKPPKKIIVVPGRLVNVVA